MYIAWPSHNRVDSLLRSIKSFYDSFPHFKFVIANSGEIFINELLEEHKIPALVLEGSKRKEWQDRFIMECLKQNISRDLINFSLGNSLKTPSKVISTGGNRNLLLLSLVGEKFLTVDDDVVLEVRKLTSPNSPHIVPENSTNPLSCLYFKNRDELLALKNQMPIIQNIDFINEHLSALSYVQDKKRCGVSLSGYFGDSGFQGPRNIFYSHENSVRDLLKNENTLSYALKSRNIWRVTSQNNMRETSNVMLMCAGLANDLELPPFFPYGRNQDGAFGFAIKGCLESIFVGHLSLSIFHDPLNPRKYEHDFSPLQIRINDLIVLIWIELLKMKKEKNYKNASLHFSEFANDPNFERHLLALVSHHFKERATNIQKRIDMFPNTVWAELAEKEKEACLNSSTHSSYLIPEEAKVETNTEAEAIELTKQWIYSYSDLLAHWPTMRKIAKASFRK